MASGGSSSGFELFDLDLFPIVRQQLYCGQTEKQLSATRLLLSLRQAWTYCKGGEEDRFLFPFPIQLLRVDAEHRGIQGQPSPAACVLEKIQRNSWHWSAAGNMKDATGKVSLPVAAPGKEYAL